MTAQRVSPRLVNLGCGSRYHPDWINIDVAPRGPGVIRHDLSRGIPLADASCDVVYHSAVLEHIRPADAPGFLRECRRVMRPGGILRVAVPDLERICQVYLSRLQAALNGEPGAASDYDWMMLELFDQTVRERSGGDMLAYLRQQPLPNEAFVLGRIGVEGQELLEAMLGDGDSKVVPPVRRVLRAGWRLLSRARRLVWRCSLGAARSRALEIGRFRLGGEVHQWMYDRYSLARLLVATGFAHPVLQSARTSQIPNWVGYNLDTLPDGTIIKPDLFYMEAVKLGAPAHG